MRAYIYAVCLFLLSAASSQANICKWNTSMRTFTGPALEQALCLLTPVKATGSLSLPLTALPSSLEELTGQPFSLPRQQVEKFLYQKNLAPQDYGGATGIRVSLAQGNAARYFVIHGTNHPQFDIFPFPSDINTSPIINNFKQFGRHYHVIINRSGHAHTALDFFTPLRATRFERKKAGKKAKGLFLHVGLIQPLARLQDGTHKIPDPAFTKAQYQHLAICYIAASQRAGTWLIPAYAAVIDHSIAQGGKGPRGFSLVAWAEAIRIIYRQISSPSSTTQ